MFEELGSGAVAKVYRGTYNGEACAIKRLRFLSKEQRRTLTKEYSVLKRLTHKNIINVKTFIPTEDALILELCGIKSNNREIIDVKQWAQNVTKNEKKPDFGVFHQIFDGLSYLHNNNVLHCDLKSANCLVTGSMNCPIVKLADFGIAYFEAVTQTETQMSQVCDFFT